MAEETVDRRIGLATRDIAVAVDAAYGLGDIELHRLGGEFDQTFAATTTSGQRTVVKIYRVEETDNVRWQHRLMDQLQGVVPVPSVLRGRCGADVSVLDDDLCLGVYSWIEGTLLSDLDEHSEGLLIDWGRTAGSVVAGLAGMQVGEQLAVTHGWDLLAAPATINAVLPMIVDAEHREMALSAVRTFDAVIAPRVNDLPTGVVHQDLNDFNLFCNGALGRVTGVIDFADALYTARVCEAAIAGAYAMLRKEDPIGALVNIATGFDQIVTLDDTEIALIYPLAMIRLAVNAVIWTARRGGPTEKYGHARSRHTWQTLATLQRISLDQAETRLRGSLDR